MIRTYDSATNKTYVTVIDNETGAVVDAPIEMDGDGQYFNNGKFQVVGNRAYLQTAPRPAGHHQRRNWRSSIPKTGHWSPPRQYPRLAIRWPKKCR